MAFRGRLSTAHEYDANSQCIYCGMYKVNVEALNHVCTALRERLVDMAELKKEEKEVENGQ